MTFSVNALNDIVRRYAVLVLLACLVVGCGGDPQDDASIKAIEAGKQKMLQNPSESLAKWLLRNADAADNIAELWFSDADLADPQFAYFADLSQLSGLRRVRFYSTRNTDSFGPKLAAFSNMDALAYYETDLSDSGLADVAKLTQLKELWIEFQGDRITTRGLAGLTALQGLKKLHLTHDARLQVSELQSALPSCRIDTEYIPSGQWGNR